MVLKEIEHVFFDLDRTLWDFETNSEATLKELFQEFELNSKLGITDAQFIHEYKRINEIFWEDYRNGVIEKKDLRYGRFETALRFFDYNDKPLAAQIGELYISRSPRKTGLIDGAIEVLEYLKPKYQLHIITNGFEEVQHIKMQSSGLDGYFRQHITSEGAGAKKPSRIIFDHAAQLAQSAADNSVMIGDHFEADIEGALNVGWKAIFYEPEQPKADGTDYVHIHHLTELLDIL